MTKTKLILGILGLLVLAAGLAVGIFLVKQNQEIREKAAPSTSLSVSPGTQTKNPGQSVNFQVVASTGTNQVTGFDLVLSFDPNVFNITSIQKGADVANLDQELKKTIDNSGGKISYSAYTLDKTKAVQGASLEVLTIAGVVKNTAAGGSYKLDFASTSAIAGVSEGQNLLTGTTPGVVNVASGAVTTPTPTPRPSATPTPTTIGGIGGGATATPTTRPTTTPTPASLPNAGNSLPTLLLIGVSGVSVLGTIFLLRMSF